MHEHVHAAEEDARWWPNFRPRQSVRARRMGHRFDYGGRIYEDGYVMRGADGLIVVLTVREFEAIYEPAGAGE